MMLDRNALLIVIDFQEKMIPHIEEEDIITNPIDTENWIITEEELQHEAL